MSKRNSTVKIVDGKVVFSTEVLSYFENLRTEENSEWIDKYFEVLSDVSNFDSKKYNQHHIRPCCTFKDDEHKKRKETQKLGDAFNGNIIKVSVYNHLFAHYYLWKIFNNRDSKEAFQRMCGEGKYIDNLTEDEIKEIAILNEECANKNKTDEEKKEKRSMRNKKQYKEHKEEYSEKSKKRYEKNKDKIKIYRDSRKKESKLYFKKYAEEHKDEKREWYNIYQNRMCIDPIEGDTCILATLKSRKHNHKELYKNVKPASCVIKSQI